jgi:magnesium-transporting ATPase (P-type)
MEFKNCSINNKIISDFDEVKSFMADPTDKTQYKANHEFFKLMAVCHTVVIDIDKDTEK